MRLIVLGAAGRMGRQLISAIHHTAETQLAAAAEHDGSDFLGQDSGELAGLGANGIPVRSDVEDILRDCDGIIDFTTPACTRHYVALAAQFGIAHVIGTTGLSDDDKAAIADAARRAIIVQSGNMSLGVNLLAALVRHAAAALDDDYDIEILEMHHRHKVDAPSGTALMLGEAAAKGRDIDLSDNTLVGREGTLGARPPGGIGFATLRGGSVVGSHGAIFATEGERLELNHIAEDRSLFSKGAIRAALWAEDQRPGLYSMQDVLGLTT